MIKTNRTKFNVSKDTSKRTYDNAIYDSQKEMEMYINFILPQINSGDIVKCERQVKYVLQDKYIYNDKTIQEITYVADFVVTYKDGHITVFDYKGMADSVAVLKKKLFHYKYPDVDYQWITYSKIDGGWVSYDTVKQGRKERNKSKSKS